MKIFEYVTYDHIAKQNYIFISEIILVFVFNLNFNDFNYRQYLFNNNSNKNSINIIWHISGFQ